MTIGESRESWEKRRVEIHPFLTISKAKCLRLQPLYFHCCWKHWSQVNNLLLGRDRKTVFLTKKINFRSLRWIVSWGGGGRNGPPTVVYACVVSHINKWKYFKMIFSLELGLNITFIKAAIIHVSTVELQFSHKFDLLRWGEMTMGWREMAMGSREMANLKN